MPTRTEPDPARKGEPSLQVLDDLLTAQIVVAWAGESGGGPSRLGWWRSDLLSEYGGEDLFSRLLPKTWEWAVLQAVREAARRRDEEARSRHHDPDSLRSLFHLGFEVDESAAERLIELKRSGRGPKDALPGLDAITEAWNQGSFEAWARSHGEVRFTTEPIGRQVREPEPSLAGLVWAFVAALLPLGDAYPLPYIVEGR